MIYASTVDLDEAYRAGQKAAELAATGTGGFMATILREPGPIYNVRYDKVPLAEVANSERTFPPEWISSDGTDVSDDFVRYARPLIGDDWPSLPLVDGRCACHDCNRSSPARNYQRTSHRRTGSNSASGGCQPAGSCEFVCVFLSSKTKNRFRTGGLTPAARHRSAEIEETRVR